MNSYYQEEQRQKPKSTWAGMIALIIVVAIIFVILYLQFVRYMLVGQSLQLGDKTSTALLLSPEISMSIAALL